MLDGRLIIGNKRYSSWSMRGWLAVHLARLDVEEVVIPLAGTGPGSTPAIALATPGGLVPYLEHRGARSWESIAIVEYCAEREPGLCRRNAWRAPMRAASRHRCMPDFANCVWPCR